MTEPERAALDHIRQVVDSVIGVRTSLILFLRNQPHPFRIPSPQDTNTPTPDPLPPVLTHFTPDPLPACHECLHSAGYPTFPNWAPARTSLSIPERQLAPCCCRRIPI